MRINIERQQKLEPLRIRLAKEKIDELGYIITFESETELNFNFRGHTVHFFPYSGWHSGVSITDGRGLAKLLKQIQSQSK